ncbi:glycosyl transferase 9 [Halobacteriovorax marinus]|uniref:Glycosyl transferase 9 n=1 Tax=Halobacteriovorax marinus TaxID=97084 RepID=A0A1Y5FCT2_9BACT|nr:glycosyl transferase 9 [Halobacteriovorax marinus]
MKKNKVLIIRFSSFGDIVQCMSTLGVIKSQLGGDIHWVARSDMSSILSLSPNVDKIWSFEKKAGFSGLIRLAFTLRKENFTHIYDAHSNLRSRILCLFLNGQYFVRRGKDRLKRIMLFSFRKNLFDWPFKGMLSYLAPLKSWGLEKLGSVEIQKWNFEAVQLPIEFNKDSIVLVPAAAWDMKRWPLNHWKELIRINPSLNFSILGGPSDTFCQELEDIDPLRVKNLAGKLSLIESCKIISLSRFVISADTGLIHVADILGVKGLSIIGPTAFGFATGKHIKTMEVDLPCRPCTKDGRGKCSQEVWQKCLVDITPFMISNQIPKN